MVIVSVYWPDCWPDIFTETEIESEFPPEREPDVFDKVSQLAFFEAVQLRSTPPPLVMVKVWDGGFDPPIVPLNEICEGVSSMFAGSSWTPILKTRSVGDRIVDPELR